jgi:hypothetical protein
MMAHDFCISNCGVRSGDLIRPCGGHESDTLVLQPTTVAEILRAAGYFVEDLAVTTSAREHEIKLEAVFFDFQLHRYDAVREPEDSPWSFVVSSPVDAEQASHVHGVLFCNRVSLVR